MRPATVVVYFLWCAVSGGALGRSYRLLGLTPLTLALSIGILCGVNYGIGAYLERRSK